MLFLQTVDPQKLEQADSTIHAKLGQQIDAFSHMTPQEILRTISSWAIELVIKIIFVIIVWYIGRWIIRKIIKLMNRIFDRRKIDPTITTFTNSLVSISLTIVLVIIIIDILGLGTSSFLALFASAGIAIGMALSGTLQNFAGGVMVLLIKPFRVGDYIEAQGQSGTVKSIQLFNTVITTPDNKTIYIPNGPISTGIVNNTSRQTYRRVEWIIGISYGDDFQLARSVIRELLDADDRIQKDRGYTIELNELAASAVNIVVRVWVKKDDFWDVFFRFNEQVYKTLPERGVNFPFDQMDVHIVSDVAVETQSDSDKKAE